MASHRGHSNAPVGVGYEERERAMFTEASSLCHSGHDYAKALV